MSTLLIVLSLACVVYLLLAAVAAMLAPTEVDTGELARIDARIAAVTEGVPVRWRSWPGWTRSWTIGHGWRSWPHTTRHA